MHIIISDDELPQGCLCRGSDCDSRPNDNNVEAGCKDKHLNGVCRADPIVKGIRPPVVVLI